MDRRELPLNALRSFDAAARCLSMSRAAEELGVTHGAVSRQIGALEDLLGTRLFERGQSLQLTPDGRQLLLAVSPAFDRIAAALVQVARQDSRRVLRVNAPPTLTMRWLIPRLAAFQRGHPEVDLRLSTGTQPLQALRMSDADVVVRRLARPPDDFPSTPFLSGALVAVASPDYLEGHPVASAADLGRCDLLEASTSSVGWAGWFARAGLALPRDARFATFEEMFFTLQAALEGVGVALVPQALAVDEVAAGRLVIAWPLEGVHDNAYFHVLSPLGETKPAARRFCDWLSSEGEASRELTADVFGAHQSST